MKDTPYLPILTELYHWLARHQIEQGEIWAERLGGEIRFSLTHPVAGKIWTVQPLPEGRDFLCQGVGLRVLGLGHEKATIAVYDAGGIYDPIDNRVAGEHYAATHFALLSALLYQKTGETDYAQRALRAMAFHDRTAPETYAFAHWDYHWDFNNYAYGEAYRLLKPSLAQEERARCEATMRSWKTNAHGVTNWLAMRAYAFLLRHKSLGSLRDYARYWWLQRRVLAAQQGDGCFDDVRGASRPIQYHAYTTALLHRIYLATGSRLAKRAVQKGIDYLEHFIAPDGDFNFRGRGQEQIFGYAAAIYLLEAAKGLNPPRAAEYEFLRQRIWSYALSFRRSDGHFPLVLNGADDTAKVGWYDYHHLTVYNAFFGAWVGLAASLEPVEVGAREPKYPTVSFLGPSQTLVLRNGRYYALFGGGEAAPGYISECALSPHHLWWDGVGCLFSCPGGSTPERYGRLRRAQNPELNFFAPIARQGGRWLIPALGRGRVLAAGGKYRLSFDYGPFAVEREVVPREEGLEFADTFHFHTEGHFDEMRYFNLPVLEERYGVDLEDGAIGLFAPEGAGRISIGFSERPAGQLDKGEIATSAKGPVRVISWRCLGLKVRAGETARVAFVVS